MGQKILDILTDLPHLKMVITWTGTIQYPNNRMMTWQELINVGTDLENDADICERHLKMAINECCLLIYTSGTTGNPKGMFAFVKYHILIDEVEEMV